MRLSAPIHRLKRAARQQARDHAIPLHAALDRVAVSEGYNSWGLLAARRAAGALDPDSLYKSLRPGELVLLAARPGQGKTVLALQLALAALANGKPAHFFSLDYSPQDVKTKLATMPEPLRIHADRLAIDCSDAISADHIVASLGSAPASFMAIDYLQLLDQKRSHPPLQQQVETLATFARRNGHIVAFVCQIDRSFDPSGSPLPGLADIRLPNPLDLALFDRAWFLHAGRLKQVDLRTG